MIKRWLKEWLGIEYLERKVKEHNTDLVRVMDEQLKLRQQYPLVDTIVVPTDEQVRTINEGGFDGVGTNL